MLAGCMAVSMGLPNAHGADPLPQAPLPRPVFLDFSPKPGEVAQWWRALHRELEVQNDPTKIVRFLRKAQQIYTLQSWNFEFLEPLCNLTLAELEYLLHANQAQMSKDPALLGMLQKEALVKLRDLCLRMATEPFLERKCDRAVEFFQGLAGPTTGQRQTVVGNGTSLGLYWGDLHVHSAFSYDAFCSPSHCLGFARQVMNFDFLAFAEHAFMFDSGRNRIFNTDAIGFWNMHKQLWERELETGLTLFAGQEWGGRFGQGHRNLIFKPGPYPDKPYSVLHAETNSLGQLINTMRSERCQAISIMHHTAFSGQMGSNFPIHTPGYERLIEITSDNGLFEKPGDPISLSSTGEAAAGRTVQDALLKGMRLGIVGQSDNHSGMPGLFVPGKTGYGGKPGFTVVFAKSGNMEDLYSALYLRHCYGTDGRRIFLDFRINDQLMGSELVQPCTDDMVITISAKGTAPLESITILRNEKVFLEVSPNQMTFSMNKRIAGDRDFGKRLLTAARSERTSEFYRVVVGQQDGFHAWSSPIWVDYAV